MDELTQAKNRYHHQLLLIIATSENKEETHFFQNAVMFDLSEDDVRHILTLVQEEQAQGLIKFMDQLDNGYDVETLLNDLIAQELLDESAHKLLRAIE